MKLRESIVDIKEKAGRYQTKYWSYRLSDNWLELKVNNKFLNNRENYRIAVIHCGKVLKELTTNAADQNYRLYIQTLPDLNKTYLVALVRKLESSVKNRPGEIIPISSMDSNQSLDSISSEYADSLGLELIKADDIPEIDSKIRNAKSTLVNDSSDENRFVLRSSTDNPFIWLKTGYWVEQMEQVSENRSDISKIYIELTIPSALRINVSVSRDINSHCQAILTF